MNKKQERFNRSQRMQMKALICVLGLFLLFILFMGKMIFALMSGEEMPEKAPEEAPHIPVIEELINVWIMEADEEKLLVYKEGVEASYSYEADFGMSQEVSAGNGFWADSVREQIADITLTDGMVSAINVKREKINGKILSADAGSVELEGYGRTPLAKDYKGYRVYNTLTMLRATELPFGYDFADFVVEDGEICGILLAKEEAMEYIRVLLKASDYASLLHQEVVLTSDCDFTIQYGSYDKPQVESHAAGTEIVITGDSPYLTSGRVTITPGILTGKVILKSVNRNQGTPAYRGHIELLGTKEGIAVINEVPLEEYLYSVVPSEMPASYPEEALKAQAICARTYAYGHMQQAGYPEYGAHVDDSTSYQVYNNILEQESTTTAAKATYGQLLLTEMGGLAGTYYYSTSCGIGTDANVWKTTAAQGITYLTAKELSRTSMSAIVNSMSGQNVVGVSEGNVSQSNAALQAMKSFGESLRTEEAFREYIVTTNTDDFEYSEGWYRWTYQVDAIDTERMLSILQKRYNANNKLILTLRGEEYVSEPIEELAEIKRLFISARGVGGVADELIIDTGEHIYKVITEHNIRYVLNNGEAVIGRQDGSRVSSPNLLPSAFLVIDPIEGEDGITGYTLTGGGFGHGVGMSQNGAKHMAKDGYRAEQILLFFYDNCYIQNIYQ